MIVSVSIGFSLLPWTAPPSLAIMRFDGNVQRSVKKETTRKSRPSERQRRGTVLTSTPTFGTSVGALHSRAKPVVVAIDVVVAACEQGVSCASSAFVVCVTTMFQEIGECRAHTLAVGHARLRSRPWGERDPAVELTVSTACVLAPQCRMDVAQWPHVHPTALSQ